MAEFRKIEESYHRNKDNIRKRKRRMDDTEKIEKHIEYRNKNRQQNEMETRKELRRIDMKMVAINSKQKR